ncbi:hypothetical protein COV18_01645 [Candidatus Woesearchaeota archaeon CG10_big_fil_rev_8_21_14_0_10_37_12]|nr:MAG: hypothetical protein COV18_01645 [Candidatus Woesearchaeota archaeon CG10_big_fil_rev_8_21_14_0_10_37_12]
MNIILTVFAAWLVNQIIKIIIAKRINSFFKIGGMPSSHAALSSALATTITLTDGFLASSSAISYVLLAFILHDAYRIRKQHNISELLAGIFVGTIISLIMFHV